MQGRKAYQEPVGGVYYFVPNPKTGRYDIVSEQETPGEEVLHLFLWNRVVQLLGMRFKKKGVEGLSDSYRGLPRGRVLNPGDRKGTWIVAHGADVSLDRYKSQIISDFQLGDAEGLGKVRFERDTHETMDPRDKALTEKTLGIKLEPEGMK
jgi:hypothetical protein